MITDEFNFTRLQITRCNAMTKTWELTCRCGRRDFSAKPGNYEFSSFLLFGEVVKYS